VIPFVVGADLLPDLPAGSPHLSQLNRCVNDSNSNVNEPMNRQ
jgi:hypothetical protein